ncbi:MAG: serine/threonine-protein phosphatase [Clostridia bacterium]|nr:serine/threonine-protein phosphatase [Clostridia bacterium]
MYDLDFACITNHGDRPINEDAVGVKQKQDGQQYCFVLCDGLGGHGMGDVASSVVKDTFLYAFEEAESMKHFLPNTFKKAQEQLLLQQKEQNATHKMKTTAVCVVCDDQKVSVGYVGDSRFYAFRKNCVAVQTADHSVPYRLYLSKMIREDEIRTHPDRNMLLRVMGVQWNDPQFEVLKTLKLKTIQAFLLCSDGFWELITEADMCRLLQESLSAQEWLSKMQAIIENSPKTDKDNYSAIAILCHKR